VGVDLEGEISSLADTLHKAVDGVCGERSAALRARKRILPADVIA
jgi:hypothetical protein